MKKYDLLVTRKTQTEIAEEMGVTQPLVSKWFSGKCIPRIKTMFLLAEVCEVELEELVSFIYGKNKKLDQLSKKQKR